MTVKKNRELLEERGYKDLIMHKDQKNRKITEGQKVKNKMISRYRYKVEQVFGQLKLHLGFSRAKYRGRSKVHMEYILKAISFNLEKAAYAII